MLRQLFTVGLIRSEKFYRRSATPVGPTGVVAAEEAPPVAVEPAVAVVPREIEIQEEEGAVGGPLFVPVSDYPGTVYDLEDNGTCNPTEYDSDSYVEDTLTYVATEYGSSSEIDPDDD